MEKSWLTFAVLLTLVLGSVAEQCPLLHAPEGADRTGCYIVVLDSTIPSERFAEILERATGLAEENRVYGLVKNVAKAFTLKLSTESLNILREIPEIKYIEEETMAEGSQIDVPYHLDRLDQRYLPLDGIFDPIGDGKGVDIYILDSGIMYNHEEFGNRAKFSGYDPMDEFLNETWRGGDCYGHGTRVASNAAGVKYGVAKKATLYSVRVLDCTNGAPWSVVLDGMEHAMQKIAERKRPAIVSMSLSGRYIRVINEAVKILHSIGIPVVVAAGNNGLDACRYSPASAPNAITVGASADGDELPYFTNYGSCVDIFAPGADILGASHRCSNCSRISDGTSFACPLVSGAAAILLQQQPLLTPDEIFNRLVLLSTNNTLNFSTIPPYYQELTPNRALYIPGPCGGELNLSRNHIFEDLQSPYYYTRNISCKWIIDAPEADFILLVIKSLKTESRNDTVEICTGFDCDESTQVAVFSGQLRMKLQEISGSKASVEVKMESPINYHCNGGFKATAIALYS